MKRVVLTLCLLLSACTDSGPLALQIRDDAPHLASVHATLYSQIREPQRLIIRDAETWAHVWPQMINIGDPATPPFVDFASELIIVAAMGERRVGGYQIDVTDVVPLGSDTRVIVTSTTPGPSCERAEIISTPLHAVRLSRTSGKIVFEERGAVLECS